MEIDDIKAKIEDGSIKQMLGDSMSALTASIDKLRNIQLPFLKPKKEKLINGNKATLTEGAWVILQFKTLADAENYYDKL